MISSNVQLGYVLTRGGRQTVQGGLSCPQPRISNRMDNQQILLHHQDQDQDSLLVKRRNDNHSPGPVIRELVPSSHQRSELSNTILCIFSG